MDNATSTLQWLIGLLVTLVVAVGTVCMDIYKRLENVETSAREDAEKGDDRIWNAHRQHVERTDKFREETVRQIGGLATREDIKELQRDIMARDERLLAAIRSTKPND